MSSDLDGIIKIHINRAKGGNEWRHDCGTERNFKGTARCFCEEMDAVRESHKRLSSQTVDGGWLSFVVVVALVAVRCPVGLMIYYGLPDMFVELAYLLLFTIRIYKRVYI